MSKYQLVKIGNQYAIRTRLFYIGPWMYLIRVPFRRDEFSIGYKASYNAMGLKEAEFMYDSLVSSEIIKPVEVIK